ncbi:MAG: T9SS type A sorting domain-containing protein [Cryomorphaceae bacterium]
MKNFWVCALILLLPTTGIYAQFTGCPDPHAINYEPFATQNDGSCIYPQTTVSPFESFPLDGVLDETSGLIYWEDQLWSHVDHTDVNIYALDTTDGSLLTAVELPGVTNVDWEEISQDTDHVYIGDFGNNANGNRQDLRIYKIAKASILANAPSVEVIEFSYADQTDFSGSGPNNTDFDCEAFVVAGDSICLFMKEWVGLQTRIYALPKAAGIHTASLRGGHDVEGLITGSVYLEAENIAVLSGYTNLLQPFLYLLYDFPGTDFFGGNKRKIALSLPFHQVEAVTSTTGLMYYITNEFFSQPPFVIVPQQLHRINLSAYLADHLLTLTTMDANRVNSRLHVYPNPADTEITVVVHNNLIGAIYGLYDMNGRRVREGVFESDTAVISVGQLPGGTYFLTPGMSLGEIVKVVVR